MPPPVHNDLMSIISDSRLITLAYQKIWKNQGASTAGVDNKSADGMSRKQIEKLASKLKDGSFNWTPFKRVWIEKQGKPKDPVTGQIPKHPLGIPTFEDRLVQECIRMVLNAIYEPWFEIQNCNFGFRPYKSTHDALRKLYREGQYTNIAIEGDIKGAFDNVVPEVRLPSKTYFR